MDARQLSEELNLKAMNSLTNVVNDEARGLISKAQAGTACRAIFDVVGGLVSTETVDLISAAVEQYKGHHGWMGNLVRRGDHMEGYIRVCGPAAVIRINHATPHRKPSYNVEEETNILARDDADRLFANLRNNGAW